MNPDELLRQTQLALSPSEGHYRAEERYRLLAESIPQIVFTAEPGGECDYCNARWFEYTGQTPAQTYAGGWAEVMHPDDVLLTNERWLQAKRDETQFETEYRLRRHDGEYRWHLGRSVSVRDERGRIVKWFGTATDIHDQKQRGEADAFLAEASRVLSDSLDPAQTLAALANLCVPRLADWCAIFLPLPGGPPGAPELVALAVEGASASELEIARQALADFQEAPDAELGVPLVLRTGQSQFFPESTDEQLQQAAISDDHLEWFRGCGFRSAMSVPLTARGQVLGALALATSVSGRQLVEDDLHLAQEMARRAALFLDNAQLFSQSIAARQVAEEASRLKDEFLAVVSHELRTPLTPMLGWIHLLRASGDQVLDEASRLIALDSIERNARAQAQLVGDLLDVSRITTGKLRLEVRPMELAPVVATAIESLRPGADARGVTLEMMPNPSRERVSGDPDRLQQVVWNLVSNALKFTPQGGRVMVSVQRAGPNVEIAVCDNGTGIAPEFLPHVFERFRQADGSSTRAHGGLGLGLSIVKHLVEMHGGSVTVESPGIGQGATFRALLPLLAVAPRPAPPARDGTPEERRAKAAAPEAEGVEAQSAASQMLSGLRVLVVEDEDDARELLAIVLACHGADVECASSAIEGLEKLASHGPDVLVSDIGMPGEDGYSFIRRVRALPPEAGGRIPAIALTGYARGEDRIRTLSAGFQNHLSKPVAPDELAVTVAALAGRNQQIN